MSDEALQIVCRLAARLLRSPAAMLTTVDHHRQHVIAATGIGPERIDTALSQYVVDTGEPLCITDTRAEVLGGAPAAHDDSVVAYLGVPLRFGSDQRAGALSALDSVPRLWDTEDRDALASLARLLTDQLDFQEAVRERDCLAERLQNELREDQLTGLRNRRHWLERGPQELARAARTGRPLTVAILDLDDFKHVNDTYGHRAGDTLLQTIGSLWRPLIRQPDLLVRWGGDEFVVLLADADERHALLVINRLRFVVADLCSLTAGIARWDGRETHERLLARADDDLLNAKRARTAS